MDEREKLESKWNREIKHAEVYISGWLDGKTLQEVNIHTLLSLAKNLGERIDAAYLLKSDAVIEEHLEPLKEILHSEEYARSMVYGELRRRDDLAREAEKRDCAQETKEA